MINEFARKQKFSSSAEGMSISDWAMLGAPN
ncbi:uncharacterized protein METZ01_LOCUS362968, partial [marine metagenome]